MAVRKLANPASEIRTEAELIAHISAVISEITGVQLGEKQFSLVQGRLARRMRDLKITDPRDYARHLAANEGVETGVLTSLLTTHHTYFFREFQHFEFLLTSTLPQVIASHKEKGLDTIRIWSAACSRGQEVYSLAMFLHHHLSQLNPKMKFKIMGSDVCQESVAISKNGVYAWEEVKAIPSVYLQGNWTRGTGDIAEFVRAKDQIRGATEFRVVNLLNVAKEVTQDQFDIIFCRNVFIYFTQAQIKAITSELLKKLNPAGHIFIGVSESLNGLDLPVEWVGPSVYSPAKAKSEVAVGKAVSANSSPAESPAALSAQGRVGSVKPSAGAPSPASASSTAASSTASSTSAKIIPLSTAKGVQPGPQAQAAPEPPKKLKVLCVDDSPTVLQLFKRILVAGKGFELVGTAGDGIQAIEQIRKLNPDVVTLDIHMPNMNGLQFLESYGRSLKIPVVMVSSVSREDSQIAFKCLELGAADYIEKPSLENLSRIEEELHFKLRSALETKARGVAKDLQLDNSFKRPPLILTPNGKLRVVVASFGSRDELATLLTKFRVPQPPTLVLLEGAGELLRDWTDRQRGKIRGLKSEEPGGLKDLAPNTFTVVEFDKGVELLQKLKKESSTLDIAALVMGPVNAQMAKKVASAPISHLIVEDRGERNSPELTRKANELIPVTSFVYESDRYFAKGGQEK